MEKIAIVTGNGAGLGQALTERLNELGYKKPELIRSKDFNLNDYEDCHKLIDMTIEKYGRLDLLINNLGNYICKPLADFSYEDWHEMLNSNLNSAFYLSQKALPYLRKAKGRILNIGYAGLAQMSPTTNVGAYQIAKTALLVLTKAMAKEEAQYGLLVNMMSPGHMENTVENPSNCKVPVGRLASLDEAVDACFSLIKSEYITGQNLELAGGWAL